MTLQGWLFLAAACGLVVWLYTKWIQSSTVHKIERESMERQADDIHAIIAIAEKINEMPKGRAADELDALRERLSKLDGPSS